MIRLHIAKPRRTSIWETARSVMMLPWTCESPNLCACPRRTSICFARTSRVWSRNWSTLAWALLTSGYEVQYVLYVSIDFEVGTQFRYSQVAPSHSRALYASSEVCINILAPLMGKCNVTGRTGNPRHRFPAWGRGRRRAGNHNFVMDQLSSGT